MKRKKYTQEEIEKLLSQTYKPYSIHIFDKTYVADQNGKLIEPPKADSGATVKRVIVEIPNGNRDIKYDIVEYTDGMYALRMWVLDPQTGKSRRVSQITNKGIPVRKIHLGNDLELVHHIGTQLSSITSEGSG
jgi:hypothetical protein